MRCAGDDDDRERDDRAYGEHDAESRDRRRAAIERDERERTDGDRDGPDRPGVGVEPGHEEGRVVRESDVARREVERRDEDRLPDEEEAEHPADAACAEAAAQVGVRAARDGVRRAELRPDEPVAGRKERACEPADERERPMERPEHQRNRDERPDADH